MLKELFVSKVRIEILKIMLPNPQNQYHVRDLVRRVGVEINAVRRELAKLESLGLLRKRKSSNKLYYTVDTSCVYYAELLALIGKSYGLGLSIIESQKRLGDIRFAALSKAFLRGRESSVLDVDLFVVGRVDMDVLQQVVRIAERRLGNEINYTVLSEQEFLHRKRRNDQFVTRFLMQSRTMLIGDEEEFCALSS